MMKSSYAILFRLELLHEYFSNRQCHDFDIVPSEDSKVLLNRAKILWRNTGNELIAFIEQNEDGEPRFNSTSVKSYRKDFSTAVFRFYLRLKNPLFFNYTNIELDFGRQKKFYFSNLSENSAPGYLFLSAPVAPFTLNRQYIPGNIVKDPGTRKVYEALKKYTSKKKTELSDALFWSPKGLTSTNNSISDFVVGKSYFAGDLVKDPKTGNIFEAASRFVANAVAEFEDGLLWIPRGQGEVDYVSENDIIEFSAGNSNFNFSKPVTKAEITILGFNYNPASPAYDVLVKEIEIKNFNQPTNAVPVNLSSLQPGKYLVKVNEEKQLIYYDPVISSGNAFGVIEIFNFLPSANPFSLLTDDEKIKNINYQVSFAARSVLWKYIRKDGKAQGITDTGSTAYQFNLKGDGFVSASPIPLTENVLKTLALEFNTTDFRLSPLPNPSPERFSKCNQNDYDYLCSEIYLNY